MCACILYLCMFGLTIILTESRWPCDFVEAQVSSMLKSLWHTVILSNQAIQKCNPKMHLVGGWNLEEAIDKLVMKIIPCAKSHKK